MALSAGPEGSIYNQVDIINTMSVTNQSLSYFQYEIVALTTHSAVNDTNMMKYLQDGELRDGGNVLDLLKNAINALTTKNIILFFLYNMMLVWICYSRPWTLKREGIRINDQ